MNKLLLAFKECWNKYASNPWNDQFVPSKEFKWGYSYMNEKLYEEKVVLYRWFQEFKDHPHIDDILKIKVETARRNLSKVRGEQS